MSSLLGNVQIKILKLALRQGEWGGDLIFSICLFLWCKYFHQFQSTYVSLLNSEVGTDTEAHLSTFTTQMQ